MAVIAPKALPKRLLLQGTEYKMLLHLMEAPPMKTGVALSSQIHRRIENERSD
jgi:hypothetical protein